MKITRLTYILFFVGFPLIRILAQDKDGFTVVKKEDQITIYERWVDFPKVTPPVQAREVKGEFIVNNSVYAALALIKCETQIKQWQKHVSEFKVYPQPDTTTWLEYSYHDIPWPVSDQDHFLEYRLVETQPGSFFLTFETKSNPTLAPIREDVTRMKLAGSWTLDRLSDRQARVTYRIISMPSSIPRFFTDPVIRRNLMSTIQAYIEILEK